MLAAPELIAAIHGLLPLVALEIEQRKTGGNPKDWAELESAEAAAIAAIHKAEGKR